MFTNYELLLNFLGNSRVHVVVPGELRLLQSAPFTLSVCVCINVSLGSSLSKHAFDMQEMVSPVSNKDMVLFLLIELGNLWHILYCLI